MSEAVLTDIKLQKLIPLHQHNQIFPVTRQELIHEKGIVVIVIDDDPTGTQTVRDVPVLTSWEVEDILLEISRGSDLIFILTNSRSMTRTQAVKLARQVGKNLRAAFEQTQKILVLVSRSDSTLRGHYPSEVKAIKEGVGHPNAPELIIPAFFEGGRITVEDVHYVKESAEWIPAAKTPFAQDKVFGYENSNLRKWIREKDSSISDDQIFSISLSDLRLYDLKYLQEKLNNLNDHCICVVNAVDYSDLEKVVYSLLSADRFILCRSAASFVSALAAQAKAPYLTAMELQLDQAKGGLVVVGSYVPKTTVQLEELLLRKGFVAIEIDVEKLLDRKYRSAKDLAQEIDGFVKSGKTIGIYTSRTLIFRGSEKENLDIGKKVSSFVSEIVGSLSEAPKYILTKGGITSSDIATDSLGVKRAWVVGQIEAGISVWRSDEESRFPGIHQIVFPGNVGDKHTLSKVVEELDRSL